MLCAIAGHELHEQQKLRSFRQDGSYLSEFLLGKGYEVCGIFRRSSSFNTGRIDPIYEDPHVSERRLHLVCGDLNDASSLNRILRTVQPDEIHNLGAQSHVRVSFDIPEYTGEITGLGTIRLLEAIRESGLKPKFYQASSSEMFGKVLEAPQRETTPQRSIRTGLRSIIERRTGCLPATASCSTMNRRAKTLFGFQARHTLSQGLKKTIQRFQENCHALREVRF